MRKSKEKVFQADVTQRNQHLTLFSQVIMTNKHPDLKGCNFSEDRHLQPKHPLDNPSMPTVLTISEDSEEISEFETAQAFAQLEKVTTVVDKFNGVQQ